MKVSLSLQVREAWKNAFEFRPAPQTTSSIATQPATKDIDEISDESHLNDGNPFKALNKPLQSASPKASPTIASSLGYRDECITVDSRMNPKGQYVLVKGSEAFDTKEDANKKRRPESILDPYCLVVTRRYNGLGQLEGTILEIQSPTLVQVVRDVVEYYHDSSFRVGVTIKCEDPPKLIYYYRNELAERKASPDTDEKTKLHTGFLLSFLYAHIGDSIKQYEAFLAAGLIKYKQLWMMFKPGELIYERETEQLYFFEHADYEMTQCGPKYIFTCYNIDYNGEKIGKCACPLTISGFDNPREIESLPIVPLSLIRDVESLKHKLILRAKRFLQLRGIHALQHPTKGRVMVDAKTFLRRVLPGNEDRLDSQKKGIVISDGCECICAVCRKEVDEKPEDYDHDVREISEQEMLLCSSTVLGFALSSHKWVQMKVDDLSEVEWSPDAIERLVLDKRQKRVLSSLISSPVFTEGTEGDVIGWKGRGLVMLLHGPPGTGKTLTAESVCESLKRPLYIVSAGELGINPAAVEKSLQEILELSKLWKAVILIDEADVFLEERSAHDIVRNNFVSVFLRRLEYFEGILMLTTNRVEQFDEAFVSRIHLALSYPDLEPWMRKEIWANALKRFPAEEISIDVASDLAEIANVPLNGRVISYAVRTAKAIADEDKSKLTLEHLWDVVSVHQKFNDHVRSRKDDLPSVK